MQHEHIYRLSITNLLKHPSTSNAVVLNNAVNLQLF